MARKLVIENTVKVPVKFTLNNNGKLASFAFSVTCDRLDQAEIKARLDDKEELVSDFLVDVMHGWEGQKLVVEEDGTPSVFDDESRDLMLGTAGVAVAIFSAYLKECGAKAKN